MIRDTIETLVKAAAKESAKRILSNIYDTVEDNVKLDVDPGAGNSFMSLLLD